MAAKKKQRKSGTQWGWRLAGLVLCAFFALGVMTGLSRPGHILALRIREFMSLWSRSGHSELVAAPHLNQGRGDAFGNPRPRLAAAPVALVERADGFYALNPHGDLRGPVAPAGEGDLPILSGPGVTGARGARLLEYAAVLVRAEAELSALVSEMRVDDDGATATLFLEHSRSQIVFDLDDASLELAHAERVMRLWRGHAELVATLDMTTPGQAVMELRPAALKAAARQQESLRKVALEPHGRPHARRNSASEETAPR
ncbi:MAG: cell division protein FtsQ/DivIB [Candidatus Binataceae bacterium]